jgi:magnesium transporter
MDGGMAEKNINLSNERVVDHIHTDFICFNANLKVNDVIRELRQRNDEGKIMYYYVIDDRESLVGVLPVRMLVTKDPATKIGDICVKEIISADVDMNLRDVAQVFERYRYLSLPVVNRENKILGVIDLHIFAQRELDISNKMMLDDIFQTIGIRLGNLLDAKILKSFVLRFPWLISTIIGGITCAVISSIFELTLIKGIFLALFTPLILAIGESACVQSMTIVVQILSVRDTAAKGLFIRLAKEAGVGMLLGLFCGSVVLLLSIVWNGFGVFSIILFSSITCAVTAACLAGFFIPWLLFRARINFKISSGPITLAISDVCTIVIYLGIATLVL